MTGSLVITQQIQPKILRQGDVITFISPTKEREFITHRITTIKQNGNVTVLKTKGDKNKTADNWILAGGGVVGKVVVTLPQLGYILSFTQTKIGLVLFILIPSLFIIFDEINTIFTLFKQNKKKESIVSEIAIILLFFSLSVTCFSPQPTHALLSDSATLTNNQFTFTKASCDTNTTITVSNNGAGSSNMVNVSSENNLNAANKERR